MKTAFIIAGFNMNQSAADDKYKNLRKTVALKGYRVIPVPFTWNYTTVDQYTERFVTFYNKHKSTKNIVIGNSYGAMVAFLSAPKIAPNRIFLCSLSPFFKEDKDKTSKEYRIKRFGKRRNNAMDLISAKQTARQINATSTDVVMLYGEQEKTVYPHLVERVKSTAKDLHKCRLIEVPHAPHSFQDINYIEGIRLALED